MLFRSGKNPRDRKVAKPRGVDAPQGSSTASLRNTPGRRGRDVARRRARKARRRMARENETGSQGDAADPRGKTQGRTGRSIQDLEVLRPGNEALKRTRSGRMERHQGTVGGQRPGNRHRSGRGKAPKGESRERCARRKLLRKARSGSNRQVGDQTQKVERRGGRSSSQIGFPSPLRIDRAGCAVETKNLVRAIAEEGVPRQDQRWRLARRAQGQEGCFCARTGAPRRGWSVEDLPGFASNRKGASEPERSGRRCYCFIRKPCRPGQRPTRPSAIAKAVPRSNPQVPPML